MAVSTSRCPHCGETTSALRSRTSWWRWQWWGRAWGRWPRSTGWRSTGPTGSPTARPTPPTPGSSAGSTGKTGRPGKMCRDWQFWKKKKLCQGLLSPRFLWLSANTFFGYLKINVINLRPGKVSHFQYMMSLGNIFLIPTEFLLWQESFG